MILDKNNSKSSIVLLIMNIIAILFSLQTLTKCILLGNPYFGLIALTFILIIFYIIYLIFINCRFISNDNIQSIINTLILLSIFTLLILITGDDKSPCKPLLLFCIISISLRRGRKFGTIAALMLSLYMLFINLVFNGYLITTYLVSDFILSCIFILSAWIVGYFMDFNREYINELESLTNIDNLTNLYNYRYFHIKLTEIIAQSKLESKNLSLIFLDIDDFKHYNDLNGHQQGDYALRHLASVLQKIIRPTDIACRYGGEEFTIILPDTNEDEAFSLAENIRRTVEKTYFRNQEKQPSGNFTISLGIATLSEEVQNETALIKKADTALYKAKFSHKNKVEVCMTL